MAQPDLELNSLKYITTVLKILGLLSCSFEAILKLKSSDQIFPKKRIVYCITFGIISTLISIQGLRDCPRKYSTPLAKITTILQRYGSVLIISLTYGFNTFFRHKLYNSIKILLKVDEILNAKNMKPIKSKTKVYFVYFASTILLVSTSTFLLIYESHGFNRKCSFQYHICNVVITTTVCFIMLLMLEIWRRLIILNKYLTNIIKKSWTNVSLIYRELVKISEIHLDLCQAADSLNRYFEVQILTIFGVSFYFFISIFFYFFTGENIFTTYNKLFFIYNALIFRALFLFFQLWGTVYTLSEVAKESKKIIEIVHTMKINTTNSNIRVWV
ncbi:putative gustatory receptor 28b [Tribolium madens]|uniref:putative gustatory receptor 28b n=1 Tax=Tribolium madens TaxID=41895 RepID=UPI001CF7224B|nr:putative gustatory receptor 28b [Tribolium madens]